MPLASVAAIGWVYATDVWESLFVVMLLAAAVSLAALRLSG
jgi:hypothetical protein